MDDEPEDYQVASGWVSKLHTENRGWHIEIRSIREIILKNGDKEVWRLGKK